MNSFIEADIQNANTRMFFLEKDITKDLISFSIRSQGDRFINFQLIDHNSNVKLAATLRYSSDILQVHLGKGEYLIIPKSESNEKTYTVNVFNNYFRRIVYDGKNFIKKSYKIKIYQNKYPDEAREIRPYSYGSVNFQENERIAVDIDDYIII